MTQPKRIQRKRTRGWKMPPNTVYVGRPSKWGNYAYAHDMPPSQIDLRSRISVVEAYKVFLQNTLAKHPDWLAPLRGKDLACWCPIDQPCHADVLLDVANRELPLGDPYRLFALNSKETTND